MEGRTVYQTVSEKQLKNLGLEQAVPDRKKCSGCLFLAITSTKGLICARYGQFHYTAMGNPPPGSHHPTQLFLACQDGK